MNPVNSNILIGKKDAAFFAANPTLVLLDGQLLYNENTGELFIGDGVTQLNALSPINSGFTPSGTNTQYIAGDGSYINFPTDVSYFNNDAGYLDSGDIGVSVQPYDSNTTLLGNSTTGSGSIVLATSPTFGTSIFSPIVYGSSSASGALTIGSTSNATKGTIQIGSTDLVNIGNAVTTNQRILRIGQDTAYVDIGSVASNTANVGIYFKQATPSNTNYGIFSDGSSVYVNTATVFGELRFQVGTASKWQVDRFQHSFAVSDATFSSAYTAYTFNCGNNTTQTASTNIPNFRVNGSTKTWAAGTITNQYWNYFTANTAAFASASTITNSYGLYVQAATAGTNATITNRYAAGFDGGIEVTTGNSLFRGVFTIARGLDANVTNLNVSSGIANIGVFSLNTDQPNSRVLLTARNSNTLNLGTQDAIRMSIDTSGNIICGVGAIATNATNGFLYVPTCAGVPTGTPTTVTGRVPIVADSTNNRLYIYSGGAWVALN